MAWPTGPVPPAMRPPPFGIPPMRPPNPVAFPFPRGPTPIRAQLLPEIDQTKAKHTTVFVGNITDAIPDNVVRDVLARCGRILKWSRPPAATGRMPTFGFCTYTNPDETLRALRLLDGVKLGERNLKINVDDKTRRFLDEYVAQKKERGADVDDYGMDAGMREEDQHRKQHLTSMLDKLQVDFASKIANAERAMTAQTLEVKEPAATSNFEFQGRDLTRHDEGLEDAGDVIVSEVQKFRTAIKEDEAKRSKLEETRFRARRELMRRQQDDADAAAAAAADASAASATDNLSSDDAGMEETPMAKAARKSREAKEERTRREVQRRLATFQTRERQLLQREKDMRRDRERNLERLKERAESRKRSADKQREFERTYHDEKDDPRYYKSFTRLRRERDRERMDDERDRTREAEEEVEAQRKAEEAAAAAKERNKAGMWARGSVGGQRGEEGDAASASVEGVALGIKLSSKRSTAMVAPLTSDAFDPQEEDEDSEILRKKTKIVPLKYTDEQLLAAGLNPEEERKRRQQQIVNSIPTTRDELFAFKLDWSQLNDAVMTQRITPWVQRRIKEYIGEDEPSLVQFVCEKITKHDAATTILEDISQVLDEEAEMFVIKLWRLLAYETEARKYGVSQF